jgi:FtsP/CotA-like multicopper oxidase with cupredoxin domain
VLVPTTQPVAAQDRTVLTLRATPDAAALRVGQPDTPIWSLLTPMRDGDLRFRRGDQMQVTLENGLPVPTVLDWHGIDGVTAAAPLTSRSPVAPGGKDTFTLPLRNAGAFMFDVRLLGDGQARPSSARALIVGESEPVAVDRDEVVLVEDWRLRPDASAIAPGGRANGFANDAVVLFTVNGKTSLELATRTNERLRLRFISGLQRAGFALKIEDHDIRVMALDSQPSEPFLPPNGYLVLAPGTRIDAIVDAVRPPGTASSILLDDGNGPRRIGRLVYSSEAPIRSAPLAVPAALPSNGLPAQPDLKSALRVESTLPWAGSPLEWVAPTVFTAGSAPAFRAKPGRTVVLALTNRGEIGIVFRLHGHHFRLLDRLDDGWKPYWLDTVGIDGGQTQRIAFAAEHVGHWLMESFTAEWSAPRLVRWYSVE